VSLFHAFICTSFKIYMNKKVLVMSYRKMSCDKSALYVEITIDRSALSEYLC
jgi:hypothetical protein